MSIFPPRKRQKTANRVMAGGKYRSSGRPARMRSYRPRSILRRAKVNNLRSFVRKVIGNQKETKYRTKASSSNVGYKHDLVSVGSTVWETGATGSNNIWPNQGTDDNQRVGDEIYAKGLMVRGMLQVPYDRRTVKVDVYWLPYNSAQGDPTSDAASAGDLFHPVSGNKLLDPVQIRRWPGLIKLGRYCCRATDQAMSNGLDKTITFQKYISLGKKINFCGTSQIPSNMPELGRILLVPYDTISTSTLDTVITRSEIATTLYFTE